MCVFLFFCDIDNCYCDICNDLVVYCVGLAYNMSLSQMMDNKVNSYLKGLINPYYYYYYMLVSTWWGAKNLKFFLFTFGLNKIKGL